MTRDQIIKFISNTNSLSNRYGSYYIKKNSVDFKLYKLKFESNNGYNPSFTKLDKEFYNSISGNKKIAIFSGANSYVEFLAPEEIYNFKQDKNKEIYFSPCSVGKIVRTKVIEAKNSFIIPQDFNSEIINNSNLLSIDFDNHSIGFKLKKYDIKKYTFLINYICGQYNLMPSFIVFTGRGFHIHFKLNNSGFYINSSKAANLYKYTFESVRQFFKSTILKAIKDFDPNFPFEVDENTYILANKLRAPGFKNLKNRSHLSCSNS